MTKVGMREVSVKGTLMKSDPVIESAFSYISDTIQEDDMVDTKKEQERDELTAPYGRSRMNSAGRSMVGILKTTYLA